MNAELNSTSKEKKAEILAVDAVILPTDEIRDLAISLSRQLHGSPIVLSKIDYFPHITLTMGYSDDLQSARDAIRQVAASFNPFNVVVEKLVRASQDFDGYYFSHLEIRKDVSIRRLHEALLVDIPITNLDEPPQSAFVRTPGEEIVPRMIEFVGEFKDRYSRENYLPHITLGAGSESDGVGVSLPIEFVADRIVLCQLGNYGSCRKVLGEWELGQ